MDKTANRINAFMFLIVLLGAVFFIYTVLNSTPANGNVAGQFARYDKERRQDLEDTATYNKRIKEETSELPLLSNLDKPPATWRWASLNPDTKTLSISIELQDISNGVNINLEQTQTAIRHDVNWYNLHVTNIPTVPDLRDSIKIEDLKKLDGAYWSLSYVPEVGPAGIKTIKYDYDYRGLVAHNLNARLHNISLKTKTGDVLWSKSFHDTNADSLACKLPSNLEYKTGKYLLKFEQVSNEKVTFYSQSSNAFQVLTLAVTGQLEENKLYLASTVKTYAVWDCITKKMTSDYYNL